MVIGAVEKNSELFLIYKKISIFSYIKIQSLKWLGHVMRMSKESVVRKVCVNIPDGVPTLVCRRQV